MLAAQDVLALLFLCAAVAPFPLLGYAVPGVGERSWLQDGFLVRTFSLCASRNSGAGTHQYQYVYNFPAFRRVVKDRTAHLHQESHNTEATKICGKGEVRCGEVPSAAASVHAPPVVAESTCSVPTACSSLRGCVGHRAVLDRVGPAATSRPDSRQQSGQECAMAHRGNRTAVE